MRSLYGNSALVLDKAKIKSLRALKILYRVVG